MKHLKNHEFIGKLIKERYNLKDLFNLYESDKYGPFFFKKRTIYVFLIFSVLIFSFGIFLWIIFLSIIWWLLSFYYFNYLWQIKWYHEWTIEWLQDGFEWWKTTTWLDLFESLLRYKERGNQEPEKSVIHLLMLYLNVKFEWYSGMYKDSHNKNLPEFKLKEIIEKEKWEYWKYNAISEWD